DRQRLEFLVVPERVVLRAVLAVPGVEIVRSEEHTSELQSLTNLVCRLLLEKKKNTEPTSTHCPTQRPRAVVTPPETHMSYPTASGPKLGRSCPGCSTQYTRTRGTSHSSPPSVVFDASHHRATISLLCLLHPAFLLSWPSRDSVPSYSRASDFLLYAFFALYVRRFVSFFFFLNAPAPPDFPPFPPPASFPI